jgi:hypothetical protein
MDPSVDKLVKQKHVSAKIWPWWDKSPQFKKTLVLFLSFHTHISAPYGEEERKRLWMSTQLHHTPWIRKDLQQHMLILYDLEWLQRTT